MGEWMMKNLNRSNFLLDASYGPFVLTLLESFIQASLRPEFEGR